jgi:PilZ domain
MGNKHQTEERRRAQRFPLSWEVAVQGSDPEGDSFEDVGTLQDLSSLGALLLLPGQVSLGERVELQIKVPFKRNTWMMYTAEVVHLTATKYGAGIGVRFETAAPVFVAR